MTNKNMSPMCILVLPFRDISPTPLLEKASNTNSIERATYTIIFNVVTPKYICRTGRVRGLFGAGGSVSVYLQHCEPNSGCKNLEKSIYSVG